LKLFVDARFREERDRLNFRSCCEDCIHFVDEDGRCSLTYPNEVHREAHQRALTDGDALFFCKTFQMD